MATKKTVKKTQKKPASKVVAVPEKFIVPFNKKNTLALADAIYSDKGGVITLMKLCFGELSNGKDGGRTLHCAVGEAYHAFVNSDVKQVAKDAKKLQKQALATLRKGSGADLESAVDASTRYTSKYATEMEAEGATALAVDRLVEVAQLKNSAPASKTKLANALSMAVTENDECGGGACNTEDFLTRAQSVAEVLRNEVAPLLK